MVYMIYFSLGQKEVILWPCICKWAGSSLVVEVMACSFFCTKALFNTLRPRLKGRHFADNLLKCIFLYENVWILILLNFVALGPIYNIPALIQIKAWRRPGASHYLKQWWLHWRCKYASHGLNAELSLIRPSQTFSMIFQHSEVFIQENAFEFMVDHVTAIFTTLKPLI